MGRLVGEWNGAPSGFIRAVRERRKFNELLRWLARAIHGFDEREPPLNFSYLLVMSRRLLCREEMPLHELINSFHFILLAHSA